MKTHIKKNFIGIQHFFYKNVGFSLVELLVVVSILAILGVVAYQAFGGQTAKARDARRMQDLATIEGALQVYYQENGYFPLPASRNADSNLWGYDSASEAASSNQITVKYVPNGAEIESISDAKGGGKVMNTEGAPRQIGAKGVIDGSVIPPSKLTQVPTDPLLGGIKLKNDAKGGSFVDRGIGKYVYSVYAAPDTTWNVSGKKATAYQLAATLENDNSPTTYIIGNYDKSILSNLPNSIIGSGTASIENKAKQTNNDTSAVNQGIPYPINDFKGI